MDGLWLLVIILVVAWFFGLGMNLGGLIHILLVIALAVIVYRLLVNRTL